YETSEAVVFLGPTADQLTRAAVPWVAEEAETAAVAVVGNGGAFSWVASERLLQQVKLPAFNKRPPIKQFYAEEMQIADLLQTLSPVRKKAPLVISVDPGEKTATAFALLQGERPAARWLFFGLTEADWKRVSAANLEGHYVVGSYVPGVNTRNSPFARRHAAQGGGRVAFDTTASAYAAVHLWARAATKAKSTAAAPVRAALTGLQFDGLGKPITILSN